MNRTPPSKTPTTTLNVITRGRLKKSDSEMTGGVGNAARSSSIVDEVNKGICKSDQFNICEMFNVLKSKLDEANDNIKILLGENKIIRTELSELKVKISSTTQIQKGQTNAVQMTYAEKCKLSGPVVVIAPKDYNQQCNKTKDDIKDKMNPVNKQINGIRKAAKGAIIIECNDDETSENFKQEAVNSLGDKYKIQVPKRRNPKLKICGLSDKLSDDEIIDYLIKQNKFLKAEDELKVLKTIEVKKSDRDITYQAIIETNPDGYNKIMEANKLYIKWDSCKVYEHINIFRCHKCLGFNHHQNECKNKLACKFCAGEHVSSECKSDKRECVNCLWHVKNLNLKLDVNHGPFSKECAVLDRKYQQERSKINANR